MSDLPDSYKKEVVNAMGEGLGNLYLILVSNLFNLDMDWRFYCILFRVSKERVDLLNKWLGAISARIQDSMLNNIVLSIARICDHRSKDTSSIKRFIGKMQNLENAIPQELFDLCDDAYAFGSDAVKDLRDKHIAHQNYAIFKDKQGYTFPPYVKIDDIVLKLHCFSNTLADYFKVQRFNPIVTKHYENEAERFFCKLSDEEFDWKHICGVRPHWDFILDFWDKCEVESIKLPKE